MSSTRIDHLDDCLHDDELGGGPVLDRDTIEGLVELGGDDDPGLLDDLIELYLTDSEPRAQALVEAARARDWDAIARSAHALKSASANIGAARFAGSCRDLERRAQAREVEGMVELVLRWRRLFDEVADALRRLREAS